MVACPNTNGEMKTGAKEPSLLQSTMNGPSWIWREYSEKSKQRDNRGPPFLLVKGECHNFWVSLKDVNQFSCFHALLTSRFPRWGFPFVFSSSWRQKSPVCALFPALFSPISGFLRHDSSGDKTQILFLFFVGNPITFLGEKKARLSSNPKKEVCDRIEKLFFPLWLLPFDSPFSLHLSWGGSTLLRCQKWSPRQRRTPARPLAFCLRLQRGSQKKGAPRSSAPIGGDAVRSRSAIGGSLSRDLLAFSGILSWCAGDCKACLPREAIGLPSFCWETSWVFGDHSSGGRLPRWTWPFLPSCEDHEKSPGISEAEVDRRGRPRGGG